MNQTLSYLQFLPTSTEVFNKSKLVEDIEAFYNAWLKIMDKEFDKELKSMSFTSLLSKYIDSIVDLHSLYKRIGFPMDYLDWLFSSYMQNIMSSATLSTLKESELSSHD